MGLQLPSFLEKLMEILQKKHDEPPGARADIDHPVNGIWGAICPIDHGEHDDAIGFEGGIHTEVSRGFHGIQHPLGILLLRAVDIADRVDQMLFLGVGGGQGHISHHHAVLDDQMPQRRRISSKVLARSCPFSRRTACPNRSVNMVERFCMLTTFA